MPIIRVGPQLIYFAHVPKCAGSAVEAYLAERFGPVAFRDTRYMSRPAEQNWSRTSPQHIDLVALNRLFPAGFFDHAFTVVRHPVARIVSAWHFMLEVEKVIPQGVGFSDWLADLEDGLRERPFAFDNHVRPMAELVPEGAKVFHMEHGLDGLALWFDQVTGTRGLPRAVPQTNERGAHAKTAGDKVVPSAADLELIAQIYAADFSRFGYRIGDKMPTVPAPVLPQDELDAIAAEKARQPGRVGSFVQKVKRRLS